MYIVLQNYLTGQHSQLMLSVDLMNLLQKSDYIQVIRNYEDVLCMNIIRNYEHVLCMNIIRNYEIVLQNYLTGQHSQLMLSAPKLIVSNNNINNTINNKNGNCP
jgi:hypothetical protein